MTKETLEEAAENYCSNNHAINEDRAAWQDIEFAFKDGAKWKEERMYSEEEVREIIAETWNSCEDNEGETFTEIMKRIIEEFKKKSND